MAFGQTRVDARGPGALPQATMTRGLRPKRLRFGRRFDFSGGVKNRPHFALVETRVSAHRPLPGRSSSTPHQLKCRAPRASRLRFTASARPTEVVCRGDSRPPWSMPKWFRGSGVSRVGLEHVWNTDATCVLKFAAEFVDLRGDSLKRDLQPGRSPFRFAARKV